MMKKYLFIALILIIIAQLLVPVYMIYTKFDTLKNGVQYQFKCAPVDPYDAFRGRYVWISIDTMLNDKDIKINKEIGYGIIQKDENGFAKIEKVVEDKPNGVDSIKGKFKYGRFTLPIDRYFMDEKLAPKAEMAYRARNEKNNVYVKVRVKNAQVVVEGLYIDNMPIEEYVLKNNP